MTSPLPLPSPGQQQALLTPNPLILCMPVTAGVPAGCLGSWAGTLCALGQTAPHAAPSGHLLKGRWGKWLASTSQHTKNTQKVKHVPNKIF